VAAPAMGVAGVAGAFGGVKKAGRESHAYERETARQQRQEEREYAQDVMIAQQNAQRDLAGPGVQAGPSMAEVQAMVANAVQARDEQWKAYTQNQPGGNLSHVEKHRPHGPKTGANMLESILASKQQAAGVAQG